MSGSKLPAVRLPPALGFTEDGEDMIQDAVIIDLPLPNKFGITWPSDPPLPVPTPPSSDRPALSSSEGDSDTSEEEGAASQIIFEEPDRLPEQDSPKDRVSKLHHPSSNSSPTHPRFSRAFSMPLPSQLDTLQNPHRSSHSSTSPPSSESTPFGELSLELADSIQMVIQTMLQLSPPHILDPAKEQISACSLAIPAPSVSAMFTALKNLNYLSANMQSFCIDPPEVNIADGSQPIPSSKALSTSRHVDFDIGEMLQSVGDALSGSAAQAGVDLVLFHEDVGMKHVSVRGDENAISYALAHIIRQVFATAQRGDSIELGLYTAVTPFKCEESAASPDITSREGFRHTSPIEIGGLLRCTFEISHKFGPDPAAMGTVSSSSRPAPTFSTLILRRVLRQVGADLISDLPPKHFSTGRTCELTLTLERGSPSVLNTPATVAPSSYDSSDIRIADEPTLEELTIFTDDLRGKKATLYSSLKSSFAHHLTTYLTSWGLAVSHVSPDAQVDSSLSPGSVSSSLASTSDPIRGASLFSSFSPSLGTEGFTPLASASPKVESRPIGSRSVSFIIIDDDVNVLKERLLALRTEQPHINLNIRKRPSLAPHHRPRSSPQIVRSLGQVMTAPSVVFVHFTSLSNFKPVKDMLQSILATYTGSSAPIPEVMIIPKPVGPRRFLTALHTAVTKPMVDPFFAPIATSPSTPGLNSSNYFFNLNSSNHTKSSGPSRPSGSRSNSDRSTKSPRDSADHIQHPPPSPLGMSDALEYFSAETTVKLGTSPASGLVIQSPDGQPAGIFFHPRSKNQRNPVSTMTMERDKGQLFVPSERRGSTSRRPPDNEADTGTFSSLHTASSPQSFQLGLDAINNARQGSLLTHVVAKKLPTSPEELLQAPPLSRRPSPSEAAARRISSPPKSPLIEAAVTNTSRKTLTRRSTPDKAVTSSVTGGLKKGKGVADSNIVPPISVLIVDDNPINRNILSTFMDRKKIKFDVATNGQEAVQKWRTGGFHLILMDIQMPVMDGIQATKEIRRLEKLNAMAGYPPPSTPQYEEDSMSPLAQTPSDVSSAETRSPSSPYHSSVIIVALTASSLQSDRVAALAAGCNDFLTKPVSLLWLNNKIIEWGSIKALQMWADVRPDVAKSISTDQIIQARHVANRLQAPKGRNTPSPSHSPTVLNADSPMTPVPTPMPAPMSSLPISSTSSAFWSPGQSPPTFWSNVQQPTPPQNMPMNQTQSYIHSNHDGVSTSFDSVADYTPSHPDTQHDSTETLPGSVFEPPQNTSETITISADMEESTQSPQEASKLTIEEIPGSPSVVILDGQVRPDPPI